MMTENERGQPIKIKNDVWRGASSKLEKEKKTKQTRELCIRHFTYSLKDRSFVKYDVRQFSNLFFEFAFAINEDVSRDYFLVQMDDEDLDALEREDSGETRTFFSYDVDSFRELMLRNGIVAGSRDDEEALYNLIGCSNSQVQKHCYFFRRAMSLEENERRLLRVLPELRELERLKGIPKRVKYAGLLFSGVTCVCLPSNVHVEEIESRDRNGYDFTDGPGLISRKLALLVKDQLGVKGDCPSVFQIRYCGTVTRLDGRPEGFVCKGVLVVDPRNEDSYHIQVRRSMLKIPSSQEACEVLQNTLGICKYSQPSPGRLGQQLICLLSGSVDKNDFLRIQKEHLEYVKIGLEDPFGMAWVLALDRKQASWSNFHKLIVDESKCTKHLGKQEIPPLYIKCGNAFDRDHGKSPSRKVQLPIAASRNLFGAVFPELLDDFLDEGECVVLLEDGPLRPKWYNKKEDLFVIVSRSPSYYPGDVRVLRVVTLPDTHPILGLRNCIIFSTKGRRPNPDMMGGGDMDGDEYLCIWHPILLKYAASLRAIPPADYDDSAPLSGEPSSSPKSDWIHYIAITDNSMLGAVESTFYKLAKQFGIDSPQIALLNKLFASLVDRIPTSLEAFRELKSSVSGVVPSRGCVWEEMAAVQKKQFDSRQKFPQLTDAQKQNSYVAFRKAASWALSNAHILKSRLTIDFGYHFLESTQSPYISDTMNVLIEHTKARRKAGHQEAVLEPGAVFPDRKVLWDYKISSDEAGAVSELVRRSRELFRGPLNEIDNRRTAPNMTFEEQQSRKKDLCLKKDNEIVRLEQCKQELLGKCHQAEERFQAWLGGMNICWGKLKAQKQSQIACEHTKASEQLKELQKQQSRLDIVIEELGSRWFWEVWSGANREAEDTKRIIQERISNNELQYQLIRNTKKQLLEDLCCIEKDAAQEEKSGRKTLTKELAKLNEEGGSLEVEIATKKKEFDDVISGRKKQQLKEKEANIESELCNLRRELNEERESLAVEIATKRKEFDDVTSGCKKQQLKEKEANIDQESCDLRPELEDAVRKVQSRRESNILQFREKIESRTKTLTDTREHIDSIFCGDTSKRAAALMDELKEQKGSLQLGLGHIRHKASQAKRKWSISVKSEATTLIQRGEAWNAVMIGLERVFVLEENRLLGFPRGGQRQGPMPVYHQRALLRRLMSSSQAVIITAGTGCGKSTNLPQYIADDFYLYGQRGDGACDLVSDAPVRICCTQPRRVAAQKLAARVAQEYITELGGLVGFKVGSRRGRAREECEKISEDTVIEFVTEGLLLHNLASSRAFIERYDCIIIDEMHERNAEQDLCLSLLRDYLRESKEKDSRPLFKVVVMSASIKASRFSAYFDNCPALDCPGKCFEVQEIYVPRESSGGAVPHTVDVLFENIVDDAQAPTGDVLVFLSGAKDIDECVRSIRERASENGDLVVAYPLYSRLDQSLISAATNIKHRRGPHDEMSTFLKRNGGGGSKIRKIICTTNIAETSLTIDGVRFVIDSGLAKKARYDHTLRCSVLREEWVSHASTIQRKGRAGRTDCGWCYYLYSKKFHEEEMADYDLPKLLDMSVDKLILFSLRVCGKSAEHMGLLDSPNAVNIQSAKRRLLDLDFVSETDGSLALTKNGKVACTLSSIRPESVRMMLNACLRYPQCASRAIKLAVLMSNDEAVFNEHAKASEEEGRNHVYGDHLLALQQLEWFEKAFKMTKKGKLSSLKKRCAHRDLDFRVLSDIQDDVDRCYTELKQQKKLGVVEASGTTDNADEAMLLRVLISGWFHNVVECLDLEFIDNVGCSLLTSPDRTLLLDRDSCLRDSLAKITDQNELENISDEGNDVSVSGDGGKLELSIAKEEVDPAFLLYGRLFCSLPVNVFMLEASVIEGRWIFDEAPDRWKQRISLDIDRKSMCRVTIKYIGPSILIECAKCVFFEDIERSSEVKALVTSPQRGLVRISGEQSAVDRAKTAIEKKLVAIMDNRRWSDHAANREAKLRFSSGLAVKEPFQSDKTLHQVLQSFGTNEGGYHQSSNVVSISVDRKKQAVFVYPVRHSSMGTVNECFKDISEVTFERAKYNFVIKAKAGKSSGTSNDWAEAAKAVVAKVKDHRALAAVTVPLTTFSEKRTSVVATALGHEASTESPFWKAFCIKLPPNSRRAVCFVRSQEAFILGPNSSKLATSFKKLVLRLSKEVEFYEVKCDPTFLCYQIRCFASVLAEVKRLCPTAMFHLVEVKAAKDENAILRDESLSEYTWLMHMAKNGIISIRLCFTALEKKSKNTARKLLSKKLRIEVLTQDIVKPLPDNISRQSEWKHCVMCRREFLVRFGKGAKTGSSRGEDEVLEGYNLTLCGCSYCRECFRFGVTETLSDDLVKEARCRRCERDVLAKDCFTIMCPLQNGQKNADEVFQKEWNQMCRLAAANYCEANLSLLASTAYGGRNRRRRNIENIDRPEGWATCPDCGFSMVFPRGFYFFFCRNTNCRSKMCSRCCQVVTSEEDSQRCTANECEPHS